MKVLFTNGTWFPNTEKCKVYNYSYSEIKGILQARLLHGSKDIWMFWDSRVRRLREAFVGKITGDEMKNFPVNKLQDVKIVNGVSIVQHQSDYMDTYLK